MWPQGFSQDLGVSPLHVALEYPGPLRASCLRPSSSTWTLHYLGDKQLNLHVGSPRLLPWLSLPEGREMGILAV